eukprot:9419468-Pyramimonas_sp.AAC.1
MSSGGGGRPTRLNLPSERNRPPEARLRAGVHSIPEHSETISGITVARTSFTPSPQEPRPSGPKSAAT